MVAKSLGVALDEDAAKGAVSPIRSLPPHADGVPALERLGTLTNSSRAAVAEQIKNEELFALLGLLPFICKSYRALATG